MKLSSNSLVVLRDGLSVELGSLQVLWRLEDRGLSIRIGDDGQLRVGPRADLTAGDHAAIRAHRDAIVQLVRYCDRTETT